MGRTGILIWIGIIAVGFYIHPALGLVLLVIAFVFLLARVDALLTTDSTEHSSELPVHRPAPSIASQAAEAKEVLHHRKDVAKTAMTARRELEEHSARELRLLTENLIKDRNLSEDAEVRDILAFNNAIQIHRVANDFHRSLKAEHAKQEAAPYSVQATED